MGFGYESKHVRLAPLDPERHFENCYRWINDPDITQFLGIGDFPISRQCEREWFEEMQKAGPVNAVFAIETLDGRHIGNSGIHRIDFRHGTALTGSFIGDEADRDQGYGTEAAHLRSWYAFNVLGLRVLYSKYFDGNVRSARMQEKAGYRIWGVRPAAIWKLGRYVDMVETYLSREAWEQMQGR